MIDQRAAVLALRNRALTASLCSTGSVSLSATSTGYARTAGSFITDGFLPGMEIGASGFGTAANNGTALVTAVSALALTVEAYDVNVLTNEVTTRTLVAESAASGRTISAGLPALFASENEDFEPVSGRPYVDEDFVPAPSFMLSMPYQGGEIEETGLYILKLFGISGPGIGALRKTANAVLARFAPGTNLAVGADALRVRGDSGPWAGQLLPQGNGWTLCVVTIPWRAYTTNTVAA